MQTKRSKIRIHQGSNLSGIMKLEVNKLGRPYHKVPKVFNDHFDILDAKISIYFLKKYRVNVALQDLTFQMDHVQKYAQLFSTQFGNVAFDIDRTLLLNILNDYYGLSKEHIQPDENKDTPVTKTEERLKAKLGSELTSRVLCQEIFKEELEIKPDYSSVVNHWSYRLTFSLEGYDGGNFYLFLDGYHVDKLLAALRHPAEDELRNTDVVSPQPLDTMIGALPIKLTGRLASLNMTVAQLMQLQPGEVLPISMPDRCPLLIGQQQLFTAVIAEERGKLFFSEFNDKTNEMNHD